MKKIFFFESECLSFSLSIKFTFDFRFSFYIFQATWKYIVKMKIRQQICKHKNIFYKKWTMDKVVFLSYKDKLTSRDVNTWMLIIHYGDS